MKALNLRGTSGAGKSFIVKKLMSLYPHIEPQFATGRRQPLTYLCARAGLKPLRVIGHYEIACGGADTISAMLTCEDGNVRRGLDLVYYLVNSALDRGEHVVWEGLVVASDWRRCVDIADRHTLLVIGLSTPIDVCNAAVEDRRRAKMEITGREPAPLKLDRHGNPKNSMAKYKALITQRAHFKTSGVDFRVLDREQAMAASYDFLEIPTELRS